MPQVKSSMSSTWDTGLDHVLILGATGFVGTEVCKLLLASGRWRITALSRRGAPQGSSAAEADVSRVEWVKCDATNASALQEAMRSRGPFRAVIHCMGALFDGASGLRLINKVVSAAGSVASDGSTYDDITKRSALSCMREMEWQGSTSQTSPPPVFLFVSAAEAGWADATGEAPMLERWLAPNWLQRYLAAKRAVEGECRTWNDGAGGTRRAVVFRPSFIWAWSKLDILLPSGLFMVLNALCIPGFDRPVHVATISSAMCQALEDVSARGVQRFGEMDGLREKWKEGNRKRE